MVGCVMVCLLQHSHDMIDKLVAVISEYLGEQCMGTQWAYNAALGHNYSRALGYQVGT